MAKMITSAIEIKVSKLVKNHEEVEEIFENSVVEQLEAVIEELVNDPRAMIEIFKE